jgi:peroxiredoxin
LNAFDMTLAILVLLTTAIAAWLVYNLIMQNGRLMLRVDMLEQSLIQQGILQQGVSAVGFPPGSVLNDFALPVLGGGTMTLSQWRGRKVALIFLSPTCKHCETLLPDLARLLPEGTQADPAAVIISTGTADQNRRFFAAHRPACPILLQEDSEVASLYRAMATPMAYLVDEQGVTLGDAALGPKVLDIFRSREVETPAAPARPQPRLTGVRTVAASQINREGLKAGTRAPQFTLPSLDGTEISLGSFLGTPVLLVFSDPQCGPCNQLLPQLEQVHRNSEDLQVLLIGRGDPELNRTKCAGLTFPVVLQRSWEISRAYGMFATPIAYLVGEDGILAEDVAVGGNAILALGARYQGATARAGRSSLSKGA